MFGRYSYGLLK